MKHKLFTFFLVLAASIGITNAAIVNGTCGDNLTWSLNTKDSTLIIEGSGEMEAYGDWSRWRDYSSYIVYVDLPNGLTNICYRAFDRCSNLLFIDIPNTVTSIESYAFAECHSLTSVTIPNSVTSIEEEAFASCSLTKVNISDLTAWCNISFNNYAANPLSYAQHLLLNGVEIINLEIPNGVTSIREWAFNSGNFTSVTIPNTVTSIGSGAFSNCSSLTSIIISNSVTYIGWEAFSDCSSLTSIIIPNSVTYIGWRAFSGCNNLTSVIIGNSVTSIGSDAFSGCNLAQITCEAVTPPEIDENTFDDKTIPLFVPEESIETYSNTLWWEEFSNIYAIGTIIGTYTVEFRDWDGTVLKTETVNHGSAAEAPEDPYREGYTFIGWDVDFNSVKEDLIVTAQYELGENKTFQISFNDKDNNIIIQNEVVLKVPAAPEIEGFTFLGWRPVANIIEYNYIEIEAVYQADGQFAAPEVFTNPANKAQKLIREGNVYILHEGKSYSVQGLEVK